MSPDTAVGMCLPLGNGGVQQWRWMGRTRVPAEQRGAPVLRGRGSRGSSASPQAGSLILLKRLQQRRGEPRFSPRTQGGVSLSKVQQLKEEICEYQKSEKQLPAPAEGEEAGVSSPQVFPRAVWWLFLCWSRNQTEQTGARHPSAPGEQKRSPSRPCQLPSTST